ncbi:MAG: hypothetical protein JKP98_04570 [Rhodobacteraceae bacterium]|nr:hypothetical protein [Paracoccaceae bacterium]
MQAKEGTGGCTIMSWAIGIAGGAVFGAAAMLAMGWGWNSRPGWASSWPRYSASG